MTNKVIKEIYISVDIEADGPIPGDYSMTSLGASVAGYQTTDGQIVKLEQKVGDEGTFYAEIKPISENYIPEAFNVGLFVGIDASAPIEDRRAYIVTNGETPEAAMTRYSTWVEDMVKKYEAQAAIFAAYPLGFDWMWTYWYMVKFAKQGSPFGHSRHIDIKTAYMMKSESLIIRAIKRFIPSFLKPKTAHTHMALDDAIEQGELLMNILKWTKKKAN